MTTEVDMENHKLKSVNEDGYAIVLALMMLAILMVVGVLTSTSTVSDMSTVRNTIIASQNMAAAESAAMTAVQILENNKDAKLMDPLSPSTCWPWIQDISQKTDNYADMSKWGTTDQKTSPKSIASYLDKISSRFTKEGATLRYRVIGWKSTAGASLGSYNDTLKEAYVRGVYYSPSSGIYSVEMGYKKRF